MGRPNEGPRSRLPAAALGRPIAHSTRAASRRRRCCSGVSACDGCFVCIAAPSSGKQRNCICGIEPRQFKRPLQLPNLLVGRFVAAPAEHSAQHLDYRIKGCVLKERSGRHPDPCISSRRSRSWNCRIRRDLPMPASPTINTTWPSPSNTPSQRFISRRNSSSRPTNGVSPRAAAAA